MSWNCGSCTFENGAFATACRMCETRRPAGAGEEAGDRDASTGLRRRNPRAGAGASAGPTGRDPFAAFDAMGDALKEQGRAMGYTDAQVGAMMGALFAGGRAPTGKDAALTPDSGRRSRLLEKGRAMGLTDAQMEATGVLPAPIVGPGSDGESKADVDGAGAGGGAGGEALCSRVRGCKCTACSRLELRLAAASNPHKDYSAVLAAGGGIGGVLAAAATGAGASDDDAASAGGDVTTGSLGGTSSDAAADAASLFGKVSLDRSRITITVPAGFYAGDQFAVTLGEGDGAVKYALTVPEGGGPGTQIDIHVGMDGADADAEAGAEGGAGAGTEAGAGAGARADAAEVDPSEEDEDDEDDEDEDEEDEEDEDEEEAEMLRQAIEMSQSLESAQQTLENEQASQAAPLPVVVTVDSGSGKGGSMGGGPEGRKDRDGGEDSESVGGGGGGGGGGPNDVESAPPPTYKPLRLKLPPSKVMEFKIDQGRLSCPACKCPGLVLRRGFAAIGPGAICRCPSCGQGLTLPSSSHTTMEMELDFTGLSCAECHTELSLPSGAAPGMECNCPMCGQRLTVPSDSSGGGALSKNDSFGEEKYSKVRQDSIPALSCGVCVCVCVLPGVRCIVQCVCCPVCGVHLWKLCVRRVLVFSHPTGPQ